MNKQAYENKIKAPLLYIELLGVIVIIMTLTLPLIGYPENVRGFQVIAKWASQLGSGIIVILTVTMLVGTHGGLFNWFSVTGKPYPVGTWIFIRVGNFFGSWFFFGIESVRIYFWLVLFVDIVFLWLVYRDYNDYSFEAEEYYVEVKDVRKNSRKL